MKFKIIIISIIWALVSTGTFANAQDNQSRKPHSERIAQNLIKHFDTDNSTALNKLELSEAIDFLNGTRPLFNGQLDYVAINDVPSAPPRIAVGLVEGFDSDDDYQLTENELILAFSYLRRLSISQDTVLAIAD